MEEKQSSMIMIGGSSNKEDELLNSEIEKLCETLPTLKGYMNGSKVYEYKGFCCDSRVLPGVFLCQQRFQATDSDIILATLPKSGTTWLKSLIFSVVNRNRFKPEDSPLLTTNPHDLMPFLELAYYDRGTYVPDQHLDHSSYPRIFSTHMHFPLLPPSIKDSKFRIVYCCRNPLDVFISCWQFAVTHGREANKPAFSIDEAYEKFCQGIFHGGPFWDSILGYWNMSLEKPEKVLFVKYEDLKEDVVSQLKILATFLGFPFTVEEEAQGVVEDIAKLCGFENLKNLEVNQSGELRKLEIPKNSYFRKGEVGDYINHLSPSMVENLENLMEDKFRGSGLVFKFSHKA